MTRRMTPGWLQGLRWAGWLLAPLPVIAAGVLAWHVWWDKSGDAASAARNWDAVVERIRACRRARPGPMADWRVCEEQILAEDWRAQDGPGNITPPR